MKAEDLLQGIKFVMPGVDQTQFGSEGADLVTFEDKWIRSYDGTLSISYPLDTGIECNVVGKPLYDLLNRMGGGNIRLSVDEDQFCLRGANKKLKLKILERHLEDILDLDAVVFGELPKDFSEGLGLCAFSISRDPTMGVLTGAYISDATILASDNFRISHYEMEGAVDGTMVLPVECVSYVMKMGRIEGIAVAENWAHFRNDSGIVFSSRLVEPEGFKADRMLEILDVEKSGAYVLPEGIIDAISRAEVLNSEDSLGQSFVTLGREKDNLVVVGEKKGIGDYEERMKWETDFSEGDRLRMSPDFLMKILKITREFSMDAKGKFAIFSKESKFRHLESVVRD